MAGRYPLMARIRACRRLCAAGLVLLLTSACVEPATPSVQGYLYVGLGSYLGEFNLSTGDVAPVTRLGDLRIHRVSGFGDRGFVFSVEDARRGNGRWRILRFDPTNHRSSFLMSGTVVAEVPALGGFVVDDGQRLILVASATHSRVRRVLHERPLHDRVSAVTLRRHELLMQTTGSRDSPIERIELGENGMAKGEVEPMVELSRICILDGAIWIDELERLLCRDADEGHRYRLVSLDGEVEDDLVPPGGTRVRAVGHLPDSGTIVFSGRRTHWFTRREEYPVLAYGLRDGRWRELAPNQYLGLSVVYRRFGLSSRSGSQ